MPSNNSSDFKKLVKEVGIRKAIEIMKEKGIIYSGDFTVDHRTDSHFSTPHIIENQKMNNSIECTYDILYASSRPSGNLYQQAFYHLDEPTEKSPSSNSIFDILELVAIPDGSLEFQETTAGRLVSPSQEFPSVNQ